MESKIMFLVLVMVLCFINVTRGLSESFRLEFMQKSVDILGDCISETGASDEDLTTIMEKNIPETKEGKCLMFCVMRKFELSQDGRPDKNTVLTFFEPIKEEDPDTYQKFGDIAEKCQSELASDPETDECELAAKTSTCMYKTGLKMGLKEEDFLI